MSSRGAVAKIGYVTMDAYMTIKITDSGVKILEGLNGNHSLPEISHSPNSIYAKLKKDKKTLHEIRFFDENCNCIFEIGYHPEPNLNNKDRNVNILHFHYYNKNFDRSNAIDMKFHNEIKEKYKIYLEEFGLYD